MGRGWLLTAAAALLAILLLPLQTTQAAEDRRYYSRDLADSFQGCHPSSPKFDGCVLRVLNTLNHLFPTGVPKYDIPPLDPFFAAEVASRWRHGLFFSYRVVLNNVTESGWTNSTVTSFRSDLKEHRVTVRQNWPDKRLAGGYTFEMRMPGGATFTNRGKFRLILLGFNQETELQRVPGELDSEGTPLIRVRVRIQEVRDLKLHISNLVFGRPVLEAIVDSIINFTWRPFYPLSKSLVNELVSSAFTVIFTRAFRSVPLEEIFPST